MIFIILWAIIVVVGLFLALPWWLNKYKTWDENLFPAYLIAFGPAWPITLTCVLLYIVFVIPATNIFKKSSTYFKNKYDEDQNKIDEGKTSYRDIKYK